MGDQNPNGILVIDKPKGMTSHDVVNAARRLFKIKKVGHAGTLDPIATGILIILVGKATKKSSQLMTADKEYNVTMRLGETTETGDAEGAVIRTAPIAGITADKIVKTMSDFVGVIEQIPPMYSAVKFKGRSLYKLARKGISVARKPRPVMIEKIDIRDINLPYVRFEVVCGKGTYIRQLCTDIGEKLGCGAHMTSLRRTRAGDYRISQAKRIDELAKLTEDELGNLLIRTD